MAPVVRALRAERAVEPIVCVTAQHREMLDQVLATFAITPDVDLSLMRPGQAPAAVLARAVEALTPVLEAHRPDWVLVQGDTTTVLAASLAASYHRVRIGHVEAGLRTATKLEPFPEELNRRAMAVLSDLHFAPTPSAAANLRREGISQDDILVTGNTVIDALLTARDLEPPARARELLAAIPGDRRVVLLTTHRRESFGKPLRDVFLAVRSLAEADPGVHVVFPVHPNPQVRADAGALLGEVANVTLTEPLDYASLVAVLARAHLVLTDSGGLQEEAPSLGVPVLVLRETTERPEAVEAGVSRLVGTDAARIFTTASTLLRDRGAHAVMARRVNPYGDGRAAARIVDALLGRPVEPFVPARGPGTSVLARVAALREVAS